MPILSALEEAFRAQVDSAPERLQQFEWGYWHLSEVRANLHVGSEVFYGIEATVGECRFPDSLLYGDGRLDVKKYWFPYQSIGQVVRRFNICTAGGSRGPDGASRVFFNLCNQFIVTNKYGFRGLSAKQFVVDKNVCWLFKESFGQKGKSGKGKGKSGDHYGAPRSGAFRSLEADAAAMLNEFKHLD